MSQKRSRLEVVRDILEVLKNNRKVKITHLIYKSNLSNNSIKKYLDELLGNKLVSIEENAGKRIYKLTDRGYRFLQEFSQMKLFSESYGLHEFF